MRHEEGATLWFTGLPGAGKTTLALALREILQESGVPTFLLDGDDLRTGLNRDLGYGDEDRVENVRRVGEVAILAARTGHIALATVISPFAAGRDSVRSRHAEKGVPFFEVFVSTPLEICEERDPKGLYARARRGELSDFTGISSPYEAPVRPDVEIKTVGRSPDACAEQLMDELRVFGLVGKLTASGH